MNSKLLPHLYVLPKVSMLSDLHAFTNTARAAVAVLKLVAPRTQFLANRAVVDAVGPEGALLCVNVDAVVFGNCEGILSWVPRRDLDEVGVVDLSKE
jgi:hypothetical protein